MKRLAAWIAGAAGAAVGYRWLRGRSAVSEWPGADEQDARAEELRAKLAESRAGDEPSAAEPSEPPESVEERRRRVHDAGRGAIDEMQGE